MKKNFLKKSILLGLTLAAVTSFAEGAQVIPNTVTSDATIVLGAGDTGINTPGTCDINNSTGTLNVTTSTNGRLLVLGSGNTVINGNVNYVLANGSGDPALFDQTDGTTTINGKLVMDTTFNPPSASSSPYILIARGTSEVNIRGGAYIKAQMTGPYAKENGVQANAIYTNGNGKVNITGDEAVIISVTHKPDAITAKGGGTAAVTINTQKTNVIGSMDFISGSGPSWNDA